MVIGNITLRESLAPYPVHGLPVFISMAPIAIQETLVSRPLTAIREIILAMDLAAPVVPSPPFLTNGPSAGQ